MQTCKHKVITQITQTDKSVNTQTAEHICFSEMLRKDHISHLTISIHR